MFETLATITLTLTALFTPEPMEAAPPELAQVTQACSAVGQEWDLWLPLDGSVWSMAPRQPLDTWDTLQAGVGYPRFSSEGALWIDVYIAFQNRRDELEVWLSPAPREWELLITLTPNEEGWAYLELPLNEPVWLEPVPGPVTETLFEFPYAGKEPAARPPSNKAAVIKPVTTCPD